MQSNTDVRNEQQQKLHQLQSHYPNTTTNGACAPVPVPSHPMNPMNPVPPLLTSKLNQNRLKMQDTLTPFFCRVLQQTRNHMLQFSSNTTLSYELSLESYLEDSQQLELILGNISKLMAQGVTQTPTQNKQQQQQQSLSDDSCTVRQFLASPASSSLSSSLPLTFGKFLLQCSKTLQQAIEYVTRIIGREWELCSGETVLMNDATEAHSSVPVSSPASVASSAPLATASISIDSEMTLAVQMEQAEARYAEIQTALLNSQQEMAKLRESYASQLKAKDEYARSMEIKLKDAVPLLHYQQLQEQIKVKQENTKQITQPHTLPQTQHQINDKSNTIDLTQDSTERNISVQPITKLRGPFTNYNYSNGIYPMCWPQLPLSRVKLQSTKLDMDRISASPNPVKIAYVMFMNQHQLDRLHYIDNIGDMSFYIGSNALKSVMDNGELRELLHLQMDESGQEYSIPEAAALPLYLIHATDRHKKNFFQVQLIQSSHLELIVAEYESYQLKIRSNQAAASSFSRHLKSKLDQLSAEERQMCRITWKQLEACEICIIPSVLHLSAQYTSNKWYDLLESISSEARFTVFPKIDISRKITNKDLPMKHLMIANMRNPYESLNVKMDVPGGSGNKRLVQQAHPAPVLQPTLFLGECNHFRQPHNGLFAPTVLLPNAKEVITLDAIQRQRLISHICALLDSEVAEGDWQVEPSTYVVKPTNKVDPHGVERFHGVNQMIQTMIEHGSDLGEKKGVPQHGFILMPFLRGYQYDCRVYFEGGEFAFAYVGKQTQEGNAHMESQISGPQPFSAPEWGRCQPQLLDFCGHVLRLCEDYCTLVSEMPIIRLDVMAEFQHIREDESNDQSEVLSFEEALRNHQKQPAHWQTTGAGFIVRFALNKVNSGLDVSLHNTITSFPICQMQARAVTQHLLAIVQQNNSQPSQPALKKQRVS